MLGTGERVPLLGCQCLELRNTGTGRCNAVEACHSLELCFVPGTHTPYTALRASCDVRLQAGHAWWQADLSNSRCATGRTRFLCAFACLACALLHATSGCTPAWGFATTLFAAILYLPSHTYNVSTGGHTAPRTYDALFTPIYSAYLPYLHYCLPYVERPPHRGGDG